MQPPPTAATQPGATEPVTGRADRARRALVEAAARLLPERAPSTISGRELAAEAGVNYGLIHHYFGTKDAVLEAGLLALQNEFVRTHGDVAVLRLLTGGHHPYLRALVRSQLDHPPLALPGERLIAGRMLDAVAERLAGDDVRTPDTDVEAKARVVAMVSLQICYAVFGPALLEAAGVDDGEREVVDAALGRLYDDLGVLAG